MRYSALHETSQPPSRVYNVCRARQLLQSESEPLEEVPRDVQLSVSAGSVCQVRGDGSQAALPASATERSELLKQHVERGAFGPVSVSLSEELFQEWLWFLTAPESETGQHAARERLIHVLQVQLAPYPLPVTKIGCGSN